MPNMRKVGKTATAIYTDEKTGRTTVIYHKTAVVEFDANKIKFRSGGWWTATTRTRINQASNQFGLGYGVMQKDWQWYTGGIKWDSNAITIDRKTGTITQGDN